MMLSAHLTDENRKYHLYFVRAKKCKANKNLHKKTTDYIVRKDSRSSMAERLGMVKWYGAFRQYVFYPDNDTVWSKGCLEIIEGFLDTVNKRYRRKLRRKK